MIVNRHPPFGNQIRDIVAGLPKYEVTIEQIAKYSTDVAEITISLNLANQEQLLEKKTTSPYHTCILLIGDEDNKVIYKRKIMDSFLLKENGFTKKLEIRRAITGRDLFIDFISQDWVGLDVQSTYTPFYLGPKKISSHTGSANFISNNEQKLQQAQNNSKQQDNIAKHGCNHRCLNKQMCGHECCHTGVTKKSAKTPVIKTPVVKDTRMLNSHLSSLKTKSRMFPETPSAKIFKPNDYRNLNLQQFAYSPYTKESIIHSPYSTDSMGHFDEQQPSNEETQSMPKLQHQRVGNYTPQYRMDSTTMQQQNSSISEKGRNRETSHDGWTELDMYQRQREEYVVDDDMLDISADSPSCYQDNDSDTHYCDGNSNDRNDNQEMEPDCYGNFDLDSSFSAAVPLQTSYDRQNYPSQYLTDSLYNRNADISDQDQDLTNRNTFYKGQMASHINQLGSNVPPERLQTRNLLSNESSITKYQLSSLYKDAIHKGNNLLYRRPANTNLNQKTIDQNHRFGQVVAWTNPQNKTSSPNSGSEWSGSDNDLLSIDDKMSSSCKENSGTTNSKFLEQKGGKSPIQILKPEIHQQLHTLPADTSKSKSLHQQVLKEIQPKEPSKKYLPMNNLKPDSHPLLSTLEENQIRKQCIPGAPCPKKDNQKPKSSFNFFKRKDQDLAVDTEDEQDRFNSIFDGIF